MKLETFFEKFELFADAPDAVGKMRELVLEWATTGRLVEQSSADEPAAVLAERIEGHFAALRSRKEVRSAPVETLDDDNLSTIPSSWQWVRLGNVVDYGSLEKINSADIPEDAWLLDLEDIEKDTSRLLQRKIFRESPSKSTKTAFRAGDVLYGKLRPYLNKVLVADESGFCTTEIIPIRAFGFIDPAYLCYALKRPAFLTYANSKSYGMNLPRLGTVDARLAPFPLPPLAEQKRIVAKVDELMELCDRLEVQQQERETQHAALARASLARFADAPTPANLDLFFHKSYSISPADLRKSILTLAVQGKLVPQDPNDDEPEAALREMQCSRTRLAKTGELRAAKVPEKPFLDESLPFIPHSWRTVSFDHLAVAHNNALKAGPFGSALKKEYYVAKGYKIYGQEQVISGDPSIGDYYIDEAKYSELESCKVCPGDILISLVGTIGKLLVLPEGIEPGIINPRVIKLSLDSRLVFPLFIKVLIGSPYAVDFFKENSHGGTMNILNLSILRSLPVPLPPLAEQRRIVAKVDELMAMVGALETQLATAHSTGATLMKAAVSELTAAA